MNEMEQLFQRSEEMDEISHLDRDRAWWTDKTVEEANELRAEDPEVDHHKFLLEGADVMISWISTMRSAGISWEVALEAVKFKYDIIEQRLERTKEIMLEEGIEHDVAYERTKK